MSWSLAISVTLGIGFYNSLHYRTSRVIQIFVHIIAHTCCNVTYFVGHLPRWLRLSRYTGIYQFIWASRICHCYCCWWWWWCRRSERWRWTRRLESSELSDDGKYFIIQWSASPAVFRPPFTCLLLTTSVNECIVLYTFDNYIRPINMQLMPIYTVFPKKWRQNSNHYNYGMSYQN